eukprot:TRINITY_DN1638_c0_g1_i2.p1 TRINITY_DN1638_c0_g1~~TRINITY_DN1638_c0_g1_i2.p1  ORF type:complete len:955 (+),score=265.51 TRINITY_DN1638_c0_g1_i2:140-3004(+)
MTMCEGPVSAAAAAAAARAPAATAAPSGHGHWGSRGGGEVAAELARLPEEAKIAHLMKLLKSRGQNAVDRLQEKLKEGTALVVKGQNFDANVIELALHRYQESEKMKGEEAATGIDSSRHCAAAGLPPQERTAPQPRRSLDGRVQQPSPESAAKRPATPRPLLKGSPPMSSGKRPVRSRPSLGSADASSSPASEVAEERPAKLLRRTPAAATSSSSLLRGGGLGEGSGVPAAKPSPPSPLSSRRRTSSSAGAGSGGGGLSDFFSSFSWTAGNAGAAASIFPRAARAAGAGAAASIGAAASGGGGSQKESALQEALSAAAAAASRARSRLDSAFSRESSEEKAQPPHKLQRLMEESRRQKLGDSSRGAPPEAADKDGSCGQSSSSDPRGFGLRRRPSSFGTATTSQEGEPARPAPFTPPRRNNLGAQLRSPQPTGRSAASLPFGIPRAVRPPPPPAPAASSSSSSATASDDVKQEEADDAEARQEAAAAVAGKSVRELKALLNGQQLDCSGCVEKAELEALWLRFEVLRRRPLQSLQAACLAQGAEGVADLQTAADCARFLAVPQPLRGQAQAPRRLSTGSNASVRSASAPPPPGRRNAAPDDAASSSPAAGSAPASAKSTASSSSSAPRGSMGGQMSEAASKEMARILSTSKKAFLCSTDWAFTILAVSTREQDAVSKAYRGLMRTLHPDKVGQSKEATEAVERVREAKELCEKRLSRLVAPAMPTALHYSTLCASPGRRRYLLQWSPPEESATAPIRRVIIAAHDPAYGRVLTITVLEPDYSEQLRRFVSVAELDRFELAEEELQKMPSLFQQAAISLHVSMANEAGQSQSAKLLVSTSGVTCGGSSSRISEGGASRRSLPTASSYRGVNVSHVSSPGSEGSSATDDWSETDSSTQHFELELRRRRGNDLMKWLQNQKVAPMRAWLKSIREATGGTKKDLIGRILYALDGVSI